MKYQIELETKDFIPQADMSNTPDLIEFLKAMLPNEISAFRITKEGTAEMGEFEMDGDVVYVHGDIALKTIEDNQNGSRR